MEWTVIKKHQCKIWCEEQSVGSAGIALHFLSPLDESMDHQFQIHRSQIFLKDSSFISRVLKAKHSSDFLSVNNSNSFKGWRSLKHPCIHSFKVSPQLRRTNFSSVLKWLLFTQFVRLLTNLANFFAALCVVKSSLHFKPTGSQISSALCRSELTHQLSALANLCLCIAVCQSSTERGCMTQRGARLPSRHDATFERRLLLLTMLHQLALKGDLDRATVQTFLPPATNLTAGVS